MQLMHIELGHYLALSSLVFGLGATGFLIRRNALVQLMCIELMLNAVNLMLVAFNRWSPQNHAGQIFAFFVIAVAAAEAAVGLAIVISIFRLTKTVHTDQADKLRY
jgi:NADH-quinone oxidoreductase subunit K